MPDKIEAPAVDVEDTDEVTMADVIADGNDVTKTKSEVTADDTQRVQVDEDSQDEVDPLIEYEKAVIERERERLKKEAQEEVTQANEARLIAEQEAQAVIQQQQHLRNAFGDAAKKTKAALDALKPTYDSDNDTVSFNDAEIQKLIEPWNDYHSEIQKTKLTNDYQDLAQAAVSLVPKELLEDFRKKAHGKPLPEYLKALGEILAPQSEYVKTLAQENEIKTKAAEARAAARAQKQQTSPAKQIGEHGNIVDKIEVTDILSAAKALLAKQITDEDYRNYHAKFKNY